MANKIKPKRSYTANAVPTTSDLDTHELGINWTDGKAYTKNASGQIVSITLGGGGGSSQDTDLRALFVPPAPTNVTATPGNAQATVSWTAPTVLAQTPITDYLVQYSSNSGSTWTTFSDGTSTSASATVTGLTNGTGYTFRVAGVNGAGTGSYSTASSSVTPSTSDPLFNSVSLLLHMEGSGASFVDSSPLASTVTASGNATQSTSQAKFGSKSASFSSGAIALPANTAFNFGSGDFCIEFFAYFNSVAADQRVFGGDLLDSTGNFNYGAYTTSSGRLDFYASSSGSAWDISAGSLIGNISTGQWYHVAISRSGGAIRTYLAGTQGSSISTSASIYTNNSNGPCFGRQGTSLFNGFLDEIRITKGSDRGYTGSTITVPTAAFPDS